jgi:hypothetical protein
LISPALSVIAVYLASPGVDRRLSVEWLGLVVVSETC